MVDDDSGSERLAPVTYLFGAAVVPPTPEVAAAAPQEIATAGPQAHNIGLHGLTRRNMSVAEMAALLESREIDDEVAAAEIARLEAVGLLDDQALAETLVRTLRERKGLGKSAIASELRRRAIDPAVALDALELVDPDDELNRAIEVANKRAAQLRSHDPVTAKRRLYAYLQRRGYSGQVLSQAVDAALGSGRQTGPRFS
jgi:regulatory protein